MLSLAEPTFFVKRERFIFAEAKLNVRLEMELFLSRTQGYLCACLRRARSVLAEEAGDGGEQPLDAAPQFGKKVNNQGYEPC